MAGGDTSAGEKYPTWIAYIYVFNLVVGVGALNLPSGFLQAGLVSMCELLFSLIKYLSHFIFILLGFGTNISCCYSVSCVSKFNLCNKFFRCLRTRYISVTWINEVQAAANALLSLQEMGIDVSDGSTKLKKSNIHIQQVFIFFHLHRFLYYSNS